MPSRVKVLRLSPRRSPEVRASAARRGYDRTWQRIRLTKLAADPFCEDCLNAGRGDIPATEVDHVRALEAGGTHDAANLRSLCHPCHTRKTNRIDGGLGRQRNQ